MTMYGVYDNEGRLTRMANDFSISSITFHLLIQGYVKLTKQDLEETRDSEMGRKQVTLDNNL